MIVKIILILVAIILAIIFYQYIFQVKDRQFSGIRTKKKSFSSIKKDNVKDADFEDIEDDKDV